MGTGIVLYSNEAAFWTFRTGIYVLKKANEVSMLLLGKGVGCEGIDTDQFKVTDQIQEYLDTGGKPSAAPRA